MLVVMQKQKLQRTIGILPARYRARSFVTSLLRQDINMNGIKRERWTEADIDALPAGEHDYFERKSGRLFANRKDLLDILAKTISAIANTGGGYIILGVEDSEMPDGVPPLEGNTPVINWLEQKMPHLVVYPLSDLRVHVVEPSMPSRIPSGQQIIVIDVGDSALAPHQCARGGRSAQKYMYYFRQGGRSEPAPHFYLELLRQRLVSPALKATLDRVIAVKAVRLDEGVFLAMQLRFLVRNTGRVAAYKWQLQLTEMGGHPEGRAGDYRFRVGDYPLPWSMPSAMRLDDTILPGCALDEDKHIGVLLRLSDFTAEAAGAEIRALIPPITLGYQLATETSPGEPQHVELRSVVDVQALANFVSQSVSH
jgi:Putative DNA-binding domain